MVREEAELEEWFTERREQLEESLLTSLQEGHDSERAKARFDRAYRAAIAGYQRQQQRIYERRRREAAARHPIARIRERVALLQERMAAAWERRKSAVRQWFFERKIRRILRDKNDL
jgi:hypothetical protein